MMQLFTLEQRCCYSYWKWRQDVYKLQLDSSSSECRPNTDSVSLCLFVCLMMFFFNITFNNISVISWLSVLLVEETGGPGDLSQVTDKLYHIMFHTSLWLRFELTTSVVIGTGCIGSCKSNYHTITATTVSLSH